MTVPNRRITVLESAALLVPASVYFAIAAQLIHVPIIAGVILLLSLAMWRALPVNDRTIIYFTVAALALTILGDTVFPIPDNRFSFLVVLMHPEILVPFPLYLAAFFTAFRRRELALGMSAGAVLTALAVCGEQQCFHDALFVRPDRQQDLVNAFYMRAGYFALLALETLTGFWMLRRTYHVGKTPGRRTIVWISVALVFVTAAGIHQLNLACQEELRRLENLILRSGDVRPWRNARPFLFDSTALNINAMLSPEMVRQESEIVFHVTGRLPPGYLRGRGYGQYRYGGEWQASSGYDTELESREGTGLVQEKTFFLRPAKDGAPVRWTVLPVGRHQGKVVYYPGGASEVRMLASKAMLSPDGTLTARESTLSAGYTILADSNRDSGAPVRDDPLADLHLRQVPQELGAVLREVRYAAGTLAPQPDAECFRRTLEFFRTGFQYSLTSEPVPVDPVEHFLLNTRRGHCELFASAMTLLLRQGGIPARYVTGFICEEPHRSGRSFVARMGNAHAWVEAYDRDRKEWVLLEPTPVSPPLPPRNYEALRQGWETVALWVDEFISLLRRGHITDAIASLTQGIFDFFARLAGNPVTWLVLCGLLLTGWAIFRRKRSRGDLFEAERGRRKLIRRYRFFLLRMQLCGRLRPFARPTALEMEELLLRAPLAGPEKQAAALDFLRKYRQQRFRA